jgi:hypothetical protein
MPSAWATSVTVAPDVKRLRDSSQASFTAEFHGGLEWASAVFDVSLFSLPISIINVESFGIHFRQPLTGGFSKPSNCIHQ